MLADTTLAEDVVHDVFVSLARNAARLKVTGPIKNYLCVSCLNRSRDIMRQTQRQARNNQDLTPRLSDSVDPADAAAVAEQRQHLTAALDSLPAEQRQTVALRIYGQMTFREIGQATAVSINTVQSRYRYALSALQAALLAQ